MFPSQAKQADQPDCENHQFLINSDPADAQETRTIARRCQHGRKADTDKF